MRQCLTYALEQLVIKQRLDNLLHRACCERAVVHLFGEGVHAHQASVHSLGLVGVYLWMSHVVVALVDGGLAKEDILFSHMVVLHDILHTVEPHHLDGAGAIGEQRI